MSLTLAETYLIGCQKSLGQSPEHRIKILNEVVASIGINAKFEGGLRPRWIGSEDQCFLARRLRAELDKCRKPNDEEQLIALNDVLSSYREKVKKPVRPKATTFDSVLMLYSKKA